ncbi:MAG: hypothetical protein R3250_05535, partial [Melioribacteraceae bacterium]|nr:hypothetical protein [Melioribacteraceae bacterium]
IQRINKRNVRDLTKQKLLRLHHRIHQLYPQAVSRKADKTVLYMYKEKHDILVEEMIRRGIRHRTPIMV